MPSPTGMPSTAAGASAAVTAPPRPPSTAAATMPHGSVSCCLSPTPLSLPCTTAPSEVADDVDQHVVDRRRVAGVVGGRAGRAGDPLQRVQVGLVAVRDREHPDGVLQAVGVQVAQQA